MAHVVMTWELGGGLGHLMRLRPLANQLRQRGHHVTVIAKNVERAAYAFERHDVEILQAPPRSPRQNQLITRPSTFPHLLHNTILDNRDNDIARVLSWRDRYKQLKPDLLVFDHSPTAMLAARDWPARRAVVGSGFFCVPDCDPFPDWRPWAGNDPKRLRRDQELVLDALNDISSTIGTPALDRIGQLYAEVDDTLLLTFRELDHYGARENTTYWGQWPDAVGIYPDWPAGNGKRIFAYLKSGPALPVILQSLATQGVSAIVYSPDADSRLMNAYRGTSVRLVDQPLNLVEVARTTDAAILNGTHGTVTTMLLAGKPTLLIPLQLEQQLLTQAVVTLGAAVGAGQDDGPALNRLCSALIEDCGLQNAAEDFANRYASFNANRLREELVDRIERLLPS